MREEFLWVEKYRPKTIDECILAEGLKKTFQEFVDNKEIPNLLLTGTAGIGKTTVARALCEEVGCTYIVVNGSNEGRLIDTLRTKVTEFASTISLMGGSGRKVVILDEADYCTPNEVQPALRGFIEEFSNNCSFIFTCNFANRIIAPLHSRCSVIEFRLEKGETQRIAQEFMSRVQWILEKESVTWDNKIIAEVIMKWLPDWRRVLNELQRFSTSGTLEYEILEEISDDKFNKLIDILKEKRFSVMRQWAVDNLDHDPPILYRKLYDSILEKIPPEHIPNVVRVIGDYSYKSAFVADQEINFVCCLLDIADKCGYL
jgi:DNA polymerase III delta prime subunit|tara:strand:+ start:2297 stop:3244 length:948 start_codon:yes stop_codon:yes gene_type:complete